MRGVASCADVSVSASDGQNQYGFEASGVNNLADGGTSCEFQGLNGHPGTFTLEVRVSGDLAASQTVTVDKVDECNVSAEMVKIEVAS